MPSRKETSAAVPTLKKDVTKCCRCASSVDVCCGGVLSFKVLAGRGEPVAFAEKLPCKGKSMSPDLILQVVPTVSRFDMYVMLEEMFLVFYLHTRLSVLKIILNVFESV